MPSNNFHEHALEKAQERLADALGKHDTFAARMRWGNEQDTGRLFALKRSVEEAEIEVRNAEKALEAFEQLRRAVELGM